MRAMRPIIHVTSHFDPDLHDLRVQMAVDSVRFRESATLASATLGAITTKRYLGPDSEPERNTRETFAEIALDLGLREISSESGMVFIPAGPLTMRER